MFSIFWACAAFCVGWIAQFAWSHLTHSITSSRLQRIFAWIVAATALVFLLALHDDAHLSYVEEWLTKSRNVHIAFWILSGWLARAYRCEIASSSGKLFDAFLGNGHPSPGVLQASVAIMVLIGVLTILHPELLDRIESLRAGEVEAKFTAVSARVKESYGGINISNLRNHEAIYQWDKFKYFENGQTICPDTPSDQKSVRLAVLCASGRADLDKLEISRVLFENHITKIAKGLNCVTIISPLDTELLKRDTAFDTLTRRAITIAPKQNSDIRDMSQFKQDLRSAIDALADVEWAIWERWLSRSKPVDSRYRSEHVTKLLNDAKCPEAETLYSTTNEPCRQSKKGVAIDARKCGLKNRSNATFARIEKFMDKITNDKGQEEFWDGYFIAALADIISFSGGPAQKLNFLLRAKSSFAPLDTRVGANSPLPSPANINFYAQLADARLQSDDPEWRVTLAELQQNIAAIHKILESDLVRKGIDNKNTPIWNKVNITYRRSLLQSYGFFLNLLGEKALVGVKFNEKERRQWEDAYKDTRNIILYLSNIAPSEMQETHRMLWRNARDAEEIDANIIQDAALWASVAAILSHMETEPSSKVGCAEAKTLIAIAKSDDLSDKIRQSNSRTPRDQVYVDTLAETIKDRIDLSCRS